MRLETALLVLLSLPSLVRSTSSATSSSATSTASAAPPNPIPPSCGSTACAGANNVNSTLYICGDPRLGPLPSLLPKNLTYGNSVADILNPYAQFGGLCPGAFLATWTNATTGYYNYPPLNGFQLDINGSPIQGNVLLPMGFMLDRFGSEYGTFMGPLDAPYIQRALPPSNLNTDPSNPAYPYQYHVYNVSKPIVALSGPIAAWFGQPGQGTQYQFSVNILAMVNGGYLTRVLSYGE